MTGFLLVLALALLHGAADERDEMRVEVTPQQRLVAGDRQQRRQQLGRELRLQRLRTTHTTHNVTSWLAASINQYHAVKTMYCVFALKGCCRTSVEAPVWTQARTHALTHQEAAVDAAAAQVGRVLGEIDAAQPLHDAVVRPQHHLQPQQGTQQYMDTSRQHTSEQTAHHTCV